MEYGDYFEALADEHPALAAELAGVRSLAGVLPWMKRRGLELGAVDIINQDEFSLDFVIPLQPDGRYLVFGIT
jgi:hypothetical protein